MTAEQATVQVVEQHALSAQQQTQFAFHYFLSCDALLALQVQAEVPASGIMTEMPSARLEAAELATESTAPESEANVIQSRQIRRPRLALPCLSQG